MTTQWRVSDPKPASATASPPGTAADRRSRWHRFSARPRRVAPTDQGMVTVELVFGILIISVMVTVFGWAILLFGVQVSCIDAAAAIARQAARGDEEAVAAAKARVPRGATVEIAGDAQQVHVVVRVTSRPLQFVPAMRLDADATALKEPGA